MCNAWRERYGAAVDSDQTVECAMCGYTLHGDDPPIGVVCLDCWNGGQILRDRVVCNGCASDNGWHGHKTTTDTHPDGFTCDECGDTFPCRNLSEIS
jgi:hypothetical protein